MKSKPSFESLIIVLRWLGISTAVVSPFLCREVSAMAIESRITFFCIIKFFDSFCKYKVFVGLLTSINNNQYIFKI